MMQGTNKEGAAVDQLPTGYRIGDHVHWDALAGEAHGVVIALNGDVAVVRRCAWVTAIMGPIEIEIPLDALSTPPTESVR